MVSPLSLVAFICIILPLSRGSPGWVGLSLTGPDALKESGNFMYFVNNVLVGTPPASESLALNLKSTLLGISSSDCAFCAGRNLFDPSLSSTYQSIGPWDANTTDLGGVLAQDTISFGGVLTSQDTSFSLFQHMSPNFATRIPDGNFGLWVDPLNETARQQHILTRLHDAGELMNPVIGLRMGRTPETSRLTIGALDENDFDGTINWIEAEQSDSTWAFPLAIKLDGFRGFNGSFLPSSQNPMLSYLDTFNPSIFLPDAQTYMSQDGYRGPGDAFELDTFTTPNEYSLPCNDTLNLSVQINGVSYEIESQGNLIRELDPFFDKCQISIADLKSLNNTVPIQISLGAPFFRSVYLAYRFPTADCPKAYYGFAYQKGANRTSTMLAQQPTSTPSASAQCLSLTKPTATPSVSTPPPQVSASQFVSEGTYNVWGGDQQVHLNGVEYLKAGRVL